MSDTEVSIEQIVADLFNDPDTRGFTFVSCGPELGSVSHTVTDGKYETHVALCAVALGEHAIGLEADNTEFIKDVIDEFNSRDFIEQEKKEFPENRE